MRKLFARVATLAIVAVGTCTPILHNYQWLLGRQGPHGPLS